MVKYLKNNWLHIFFIVMPTFLLQAQSPKVWTSGEIYSQIEKLNVLASVLYVAAHPDDENTRMISYFSNHVKARTAYLSLTRGDGGQNLIGPEISELLGVIRTHELLAARKIDGGEQLFSRANDFGYSKHSDETLEIWERDEVLSDVVWAIRKFQPDVIINRFDHTTAGRTHGHHTASAILGFEAFDISGDPNKFKSQLQHTQTWKASRLFHNTGWWFYGSIEEFEKADKSDLVSANIGTYYPILGKSNSEIAAESRSQHKCQGMGNTGSRGNYMEYLRLLKGDMPKNQEDVFDGINTTWSRLKGGEAISAMVDKVIKGYNFANPASSVPALMEILEKINNLEASTWKSVKTKDVKEIIAACMGLYIEAISNDHTATPGSPLTFEIELTNRSNIPALLNSIQMHPSIKDTTIELALLPNESFSLKQTIILPDNTPLTAPYWLVENGSLGMYKVKEQEMRGLPETPREISITYDLEISGKPIQFSKDVVYRYNSPEDGPIYRPLEVTPEFSVSVKDKVYIYGDDKAKNVVIKVKALADNQEGVLTLPLPSTWQCDPLSHAVKIGRKGEEVSYTFSVTPPKMQEEFILHPNLKTAGHTYTKEAIEINYDHIPFQVVLMDAQAKLVKIDIKSEAKRVAYVMGAGDEIPEALRQIGIQVDLKEPENLSAASLIGYDAVVMGVRAYNKHEILKFKQAELMEYVKQGGTLVVQYNTNRGLEVDEIGPYPLELSRDRVTVESAPVSILEPDHLVMNHPNKITSKDFEGWVQERGLYFADKWDDQYTAILACNDPGEDPKKGGLLVAQYGDGWYVNTGYSWFRELPPGVAGAYRIFANLISLGNTVRP